MSGRAPLLVLGNGDFATDVADFARSGGWEVAGFVESLDEARCAQPRDGLPVHWIDELEGLAADHVGVCALGTTHRRRFTDRAEELGLRFATIVHGSAVVSSTSSLGEGTIVAPGVVIGAHTRVGRHVLVSRGALIGHHDEIGDHTSILPGANIAGSCTVGPAAYVAMGAVVADHHRVGAHAVVGAGAVVVDDVPDRTLVVGVPARVVKTDVDGR